MKATRAARSVKGMFEEGLVYIRDYVSDDDSSGSISTHPFQALIEARLMEKEAWPKYKNGQSLKKKPNNGQLTLLDHHAISTFKEDKDEPCGERLFKEILCTGQLTKIKEFLV
jgi:hypothetical protein